MPLIPPPPRRSGTEHLDRGGHDPDALARALSHVGAVDRWLGGRFALRRHLDSLLRDRVQRRLALVDVGTGDGAVLARLGEWLAGRGMDVTAVGIELHPEILAVARARQRSLQGPGKAGEPAGDRMGSARTHLVRADGLVLPLADDSVDVALCTLTLHHFTDEAAVALVAEMARVSRLAVLVSDLERSRTHYLGARVLAATVWRADPISAHDGPLSVLRSFTADELAAIGALAGLERVRVRRHLPFRLMLEGRP